MLVFGYILAITLKLFNSYKYAYYEIHIEARQRECLTEDIIREKYFDFFWNQLPNSEESNSDLQNCLWCWCKCRSRCCNYGQKVVYCDEAEEALVQRGGLKYGLIKKRKDKGMKRWGSCLPSQMTDLNNPFFLYMFSANYILLLILIL